VSTVGPDEVVRLGKTCLPAVHRAGWARDLSIDQSAGSGQSNP
jgi:hypothetical protein